MKIKTNLFVKSALLVLSLMTVGATLLAPAAYAKPKGGGGTQQQTYQPTPDPAAANKTCAADSHCKAIYTYLDDAVNLLSALVGVVAVAMIIYGGIEFSSSGGDPQRVASAKSHITNAIIALVAFLFLWAFLNFIIPGGLFNGQIS